MVVGRWYVAILLSFTYVQFFLLVYTGPASDFLFVHWCRNVPLFSGTHSNEDLIWVKIGECIGFDVDRRSRLPWSPVKSQSLHITVCIPPAHTRQFMTRVTVNKNLPARVPTIEKSYKSTGHLFILL